MRMIHLRFRFILYANLQNMALILNDASEENKNFTIHVFFEKRIRSTILRLDILHG